MTDKKIKDMPLPQDCIVYKEQTISRNVIPPVHYNMYNIWGKNETQVQEHDPRIHSFLKTPEQRVIDFCLSDVKFNELNNIYFNKSSKKLFCINGKLFVDPTKNFYNKPNVNDMVSLVFDRIKKIATGDSEDPKIYINNLDIRFTENEKQNMLFAGNVKDCIPARIVASRSLLSKFVFVGLPLYTFFGSMLSSLFYIRQELNEYNNTLIFKVSYNPYRKKQRNSDSSFISMFRGALRDFFDLYYVDLYITLSLVTRENKSVDVSFGAIVCKEKKILSKTTFLFTQGSSVRSGHTCFENNFSINDIAFDSMSALFLSIMLDNGSMWRVEGEYNYSKRCSCNSILDRKEGIGKSLSDVLNGKLKELVLPSCLPNVTYIATPLIPLGSVIAFAKKRSDAAKIGYFFVMKKGSFYSAFLCNENCDENLKIASSKKLIDLEKKLNLLMTKGKLFVIFAHTNASPWSLSMSSRMVANRIYDILDLPSDNGEINQQPGAKMIANRKIRKIRDDLAIKGNTQVELFEDLYEKTIKFFELGKPYVLPLSSIKNFLKYNIGMSGSNQYYNIRDTMGHFPFLFDYFVFSNSGRLPNFVPETSFENSSTINLEKKIKAGDRGNLIIKINKKITDLPVDLKLIDPNNQVAKNIVFSDESVKKLFSEITVKDKEASITINISPGVLN